MRTVVTSGITRICQASVAIAYTADSANENEVRVNFEDRPQSGPLPFNAAIRKEQLAVAA